MPLDSGFVSRGGIKLSAALDAFGLEVRGLVCADLGCNVGGFTDCLLRRGAAKVLAVDTGYGALAWKLRNDPRVVVMERTNALHVQPPVDCVDLVCIDLAWTRQEHAIPAALRWRPRHIITLLKPHYERSGAKGRGASEFKKVLTREEAQQTCDDVASRMERWGVEVTGTVLSPIRGGAGKGKEGNFEFLLFLKPLGRSEK